MVVCVACALPAYQSVVSSSPSVTALAMLIRYANGEDRILEARMRPHQREGVEVALSGLVVGLIVENGVVPRYLGAVEGIAGGEKCPRHVARNGAP